MEKTSFSTLAVALAVLLAACAEPDGAACPDPAPADASVARDASVAPSPVDAAPTDAPPLPREDAGPRPTGRPTVYYIIRHTERDSGTDPPINAEGRARAARLASLLAATGFDEIVVTSFLRNRQSAEPLAAATGVAVTEAPITMTTWPQFGTEVAAWQRAREVPGSTTLMIGHSGGYNTALLRGLGAEGVTIGERYQDLVIVVREPDGRVRWSVLEYGGPNSLGPL